MKYFQMRILSQPPLPRVCDLTAIDEDNGNIDFIGFTIERPWLSNQEDISCVPPGQYKLINHISTKKNQWIGGRVLALINHALGIGLNKGDAQRDHCYIHSANWMKELKGCVAPGLALYDTEFGVSESREACKKVFEYFDQGFDTLIIQ